MGRPLPNAEELIAALEQGYKDFKKLHDTHEKFSDEEYWLRRNEIEDRIMGILAEASHARIELNKKEVVK